MNILQTTKIDLSPSQLKQLKPLIMADFMRPKPGQNQANTGMQNLITRKLFNWLEPALSQVFAQSPELALWDAEGPASLPVSKIFEFYDLDPSTAGWIKIYHSHPNPRVLELLQPHLAGKLVIGFELSPFQVAIFNQLAVPYVSLAIHPLRFMSDYKFMLSSNFAPTDTLAHLALCKDEIKFEAQLKRANLLQRAPFELAPKSAVIFGQVDIDAALISPNGIISLQEHVKDIQNLFVSHETVYFKPHPYSSGAVEQVRFLQQMGDIIPISHNPYMLLSSREVDTIAALTSSVLTEAPFFGKKAHAFSSIWQDRSDEPAYGIELLSQHFWEALFLSADNRDLMNRSPVRDGGDITLKGLFDVSWETHGAADIPISGIPIQLGKEMQFGLGQTADAFCRGEGWKPASAGHRWAGTNNAFLSFRLPQGCDLPLSGKLTINAMANSQNPILVQLVCQDHILGEKVLDHAKTDTIALNIPARMRSALGDIEIELRSSHSHAPSSLVGIPDMRALSVAVQSIIINLPQDAFVFSLGTPIHTKDFNSKTPFLPHGWHLAEKEGIWTHGRHSRLRVTTAPLPDGDLILKLGNVRAFLSEILPNNTLFIHINGRHKFTHQFHRGQPGDIQTGGIDISVSIPRSALCNDGAVATIDLEMVASHSPALAGYSEDDRALGVMIETFTFNSAIANAAEQPPAHFANIFGPFNIHTGLAVMARNSFVAIRDAHAEATATQTNKTLLGPRAINFNNSLHQDVDTGFVQETGGGSDINIFSGDVTRVARIVNAHGSEILRDRYNICYGAWELERLPTYLSDTRYINEYWGLSTFIANAAQQRMDVPVHAFPIPVELHFPSCMSPRKRFSIPEDRFVFLFTFSVDSTMSRKNPEAVFKAFQIAFPDPREPVALVIKSMLRQASPANRKSFEDFKAEVKKDPRVILIEETLNRDENASLYMQCDAYISLHRAEGFGLTMAEAMGYGKPTIGTGYSGNLDFMDNTNSCLVAYDKVEMDPEAYHNQQCLWAEPDTYNAAQHMQRLFHDIRYREKIARAGKRTIYEKFSPLAVGRQIVKRLQKIHEERS